MKKLKIILTGFLAGALAGLLGIGGGLIMVPALVFILGLSQHEAQGTSLFVIIWTAAVGAASYFIAGNLNISYALWLAVGSLCGAYLGSVCALRLSEKTLRLTYAVFLLIVGIKMIIG